MSRYGFPKSEHLCGKNRFQLLFEEGTALYAASMKLLYRDEAASVSRTMVGVVVPKRMLRHAVDRNLMKRRIREAYRQGKPYPSFVPEGKALRSDLLFIYTDRRVRSYAHTKRSVDALLSQWLKRQSPVPDKKNMRG
ncbi:MAG: ribonuclease P protein component [Bacteroidales bacterium]|nr:ribonuclease P protein component [Bacteroidales bacterium]